jgi:pimeloyl-ACP methyl ester carboxylesterase
MDDHRLRPSRRSRLTRLGRGLAAIAILVVLFYAVAGYLGSADMFGDHPRWRGMNRGPADFGLRSETVSFDSTDGIPLKAWWLPVSGTPQGAVIIAHGIDHTRQVMLPRAAFLVRGGYDVLTVDLRGHGESGGSIVSPGLLEARDVLGALRYIRSRGDNDPVAVLGVSYGAVASLIAAAESPDIAAVISDGAFPTGKDVSEDISRHYLHDSRANLLVRGLSLASLFPGVARAIALTYYLRSGIDLGPELLSAIPSASRIRVPVLMISGEKDWIVPPDRARQILSVIPNNQKELVIIPNAYHDTTYSTTPTLYANTVLGFLERSIKGGQALSQPLAADRDFPLHISSEPGRLGEPQGWSPLSRSSWMLELGRVMLDDGKH